MTVSNEDRTAAIAAGIQGCVDEIGVYSLTPNAEHGDQARAVVNALIAHGWGPRPAAVSSIELLEIVTGKWPGGSRVVYRDLVRYFGEHGIEVTG